MCLLAVTAKPEASLSKLPESSAIFREQRQPTYMLQLWNAVLFRKRAGEAEDRSSEKHWVKSESEYRRSLLDGRSRLRSIKKANKIDNKAAQIRRAFIPPLRAVTKAPQ